MISKQNPQQPTCHSFFSNPRKITVRCEITCGKSRIFHSRHVGTPIDLQHQQVHTTTCSSLVLALLESGIPKNLGENRELMKVSWRCPFFFFVVVKTGSNRFLWWKQLSSEFTSGFFHHSFLTFPHFSHLTMPSSPAWLEETTSTNFPTSSPTFFLGGWPSTKNVKKKTNYQLPPPKKKTGATKNPPNINL